MDPGRRPKKQKTSSNEGRDWSSLSKLFLSILASRLDAIAHVFFRSTCISWRSSSSPRPKLPLLILGDRINLQHPTSIIFFDIEFNLLIHLPKCSFEFGSFFCGSSHGYLAFLDPASKLYLINPITGHQIKLQKHTAKYRKNKRHVGVYYQMKLALSALPTDPQCIFAIISQRQNQVDVCMRNTKWKTILLQGHVFESIIFYKGYFYLCFNTRLYRVDLEANGGNGIINTVSLVELSDDERNDSDDYNPPKKTHMVEFSGDLVMVLVFVNGGTYSYEFKKVNFEEEKLENLKLGVDDLVFLGISLGIGTSVKRFQGCRVESMFLTKLTKDCEETAHVFFVEDSDIKNFYLSKYWDSVEQGNILGWLIPGFELQSSS